MSLGSLKLNHHADTKLAKDPSSAGETYQGRPLLTSQSETVQGGVFYPKVLEERIEAITVDYELDTPLKTYIEEVEQQLGRLATSMTAGGYEFTLATALQFISRKIATDFPYSQRMATDEYLAKNYTPGQKYRLSYFMAKQDMVCRHMGLLAAAIIDHLKKNAREGKFPAIKAETEVRFMSDMEEDSREKKGNGHAYVVVKREDASVQKNLYYVVDPTKGGSKEIRELLNQKGNTPPSTYRYLFSVLRFIFQKEDPRDAQFLQTTFENARSHPQIAQVLKDVRKSLDDPSAIQRFEHLKLHNATR